MLFERQEYQEHCVSNILQALDRLETGAGEEGADKIALLQEGLRALHSEQGMPVQALRDDLRMDVLMETGTGKTFTYLKAMYEMNKQYGLNKFLIFVPRLAIRAGIAQNIKLTADYFAQEYGKRIKLRTYSGKSGIHQVENYIRNQGEFSVLILTSASIAGKNKQSRVLTRINDTLLTAESPLDAIGKLKPVVFVDEPHLLNSLSDLPAWRLKKRPPIGMFRRFAGVGG